MHNSMLETNSLRWRLRCEQGDHFWDYLDEDQISNLRISDAEKHFLGLDNDSSCCQTLPNKPVSYGDAAKLGFDFFQKLQLDDGHWACDYGGPSFLLPGIIFAYYITEVPIPEPSRLEMARYITNIVNPDGGWGLHSAGSSTVFGTIMYYISLRLLGLEASCKVCARARQLIHELGGPVMLPQWGKVWLACLSMYQWDGVNPVPAELWLLPEWTPMHPWRFWVQCRVVYLPMSYLWTNKLSKPLDALTKAIRTEIYQTRYSEIIFTRYRYHVSSRDAIRGPSVLLKVLNYIFLFWIAYLRPAWVVRSANVQVEKLMLKEDENTNENCLAPVNKALHMVCLWFMQGTNSPALRRHHETLPVFLWMSPKGMTSGGTNGVQTWDTAFTIQAIASSGLAGESRYQESMQKALDFLEQSQILEDLDDPYRQRRAGGWPFSTRSNGYIVSDCSAEALKAVLLLQKAHGYSSRISDQRLKQCVDSLLAMQNSDDGFGTYERTRGSRLLEFLNPADVFDRIMIEYSYPECTSAVVTSLHSFRKYIPSYREKDIAKTIHRGLKYIRQQQRSDGSWYGSWAICFTYATFFAIQALESAGETYSNSHDVRRACHFLLRHQKQDGGWGEHWSSCPAEKYIQHSKSQVTNTAWAALTLMYAKYPEPAPIERALKLLQSRQRSNGEWLQEDVEGVFNNTCMIGYPNYKFYFPIWALGYYSSTYSVWKEINAED